MSYFRFQFLLVFVLIGSFNTVFANSDRAGSFTEVELDFGISLEIPPNWKMLPRPWIQDRSDWANDLVKSIGFPTDGGMLLFAQSTPDPPSARIIVSIQPPSFSQGDLANYDQENLDRIGSMALDTQRQAEAQGGPRVEGVVTATIESLKGKLALVITYTRAEHGKNEFWQVTQYLVPTADRVISLILSCRRTDAHDWAPVLRHAKESINF